MGLAAIPGVTHPMTSRGWGNARVDSRQTHAAMYTQRGPGCSVRATAHAPACIRPWLPSTLACLAAFTLLATPADAAVLGEASVPYDDSRAHDVRTIPPECIYLLIVFAVLYGVVLFVSIARACCGHMPRARVLLFFALCMVATAITTMTWHVTYTTGKNTTFVGVERMLVVSGQVAEGQFENQLETGAQVVELVQAGVQAGSVDITRAWPHPHAMLAGIMKALASDAATVAGVHLGVVNSGDLDADGGVVYAGLRPLDIQHNNTWSVLHTPDYLGPTVDFLRCNASDRAAASVCADHICGASEDLDFACQATCAGRRVRLRYNRTRGMATGGAGSTLRLPRGDSWYCHYYPDGRTLRGVNEFRAQFNPFERGGAFGPVAPGASGAPLRRTNFTVGVGSAGDGGNAGALNGLRASPYAPDREGVTSLANITAQPWWRESPTPKWSAPYVLPTSGEMGVTLSAGLYDGAGFVGCVAVDFALDAFTTFLLELRPTANSMIYVIDLAGNLVGASASSGDVRADTGMRADETVRVHDIRLKPTSTLWRVFSAVTAGFNGSLSDAHRQVVEAQDGQDEVFSFPVTVAYGGDYLCLILTPYSDVMGDADQKSLHVLSIAVAISFIVSALIVAGFGALVLGLERLADRMTSVARMDLDAVLDGVFKDGSLVTDKLSKVQELAHIQKAFYNMVAQMREYRAFLPKAVLGGDMKTNTDGTAAGLTAVVVSPVLLRGEDVDGGDSGDAGAGAADRVKKLEEHLRNSPREKALVDACTSSITRLAAEYEGIVTALAWTGGVLAQFDCVEQACLFAQAVHGEAAVLARTSGVRLKVGLDCGGGGSAGGVSRSPPARDDDAASIVLSDCSAGGGGSAHGNAVCDGHVTSYDVAVTAARLNAICPPGATCVGPRVMQRATPSALDHPQVLEMHLGLEVPGLTAPPVVLVPHDSPESTAAIAAHMRRTRSKDAARGSTIVDVVALLPTDGAPGARRDAAAGSASSATAAALDAHNSDFVTHPVVPGGGSATMTPAAGGARARAYHGVKSALVNAGRALCAEHLERRSQVVGKTQFEVARAARARRASLAADPLGAINATLAAVIGCVKRSEGTVLGLHGTAVTLTWASSSRVRNTRRAVAYVGHLGGALQRAACPQHQEAVSSPPPPRVLASTGLVSGTMLAGIVGKLGLQRFVTAVGPAMALLTPLTDACCTLEVHALYASWCEGPGHPAAVIRSLRTRMRPVDVMAVGAGEEWEGDVMPAVDARSHNESPSPSSAAGRPDGPKQHRAITVYEVRGPLPAGSVQHSGGGGGADAGATAPDTEGTAASPAGNAFCWSPRYWTAFAARDVAALRQHAEGDPVVALVVALLSADAHMLDRRTSLKVFSCGAWARRGHAAAGHPLKIPPLGDGASDALDSIKLAAAGGVAQAAFAGEDVVAHAAHVVQQGVAAARGVVEHTPKSAGGRPPMGVPKRGSLDTTYTNTNTYNASFGGGAGGAGPPGVRSYLASTVQTHAPTPPTVVRSLRGGEEAGAPGGLEDVDVALQPAVDYAASSGGEDVHTPEEDEPGHRLRYGLRAPSPGVATPPTAVTDDNATEAGGDAGADGHADGDPGSGYPLRQAPVVVLQRALERIADSVYQDGAGIVLDAARVASEQVAATPRSCRRSRSVRGDDSAHATVHSPITPRRLEALYADEDVDGEVDLGAVDVDASFTVTTEMSRCNSETESFRGGGAAPATPLLTSWHAEHAMPAHPPPPPPAGMAAAATQQRTPQWTRHVLDGDAAAAAAAGDAVAIDPEGLNTPVPAAPPEERGTVTLSGRVGSYLNSLLPSWASPAPRT